MNEKLRMIFNRNNFYKTLHHLKNGNFSFILTKVKQKAMENIPVKMNWGKSSFQNEQEDCFDFMFRQNNEKDNEYKKYIEHQPLDDTIKTIAFYLPQFHPISENDENWGKGFTEWTNVSKAVPQFYGHYQPRLPGELGFYDLRLSQVRHRQIELAKNYGIDGFCFHFYWFNGRRVLEKPLEDFVSDKSHNFSFCVNWANENWTRRWDGLEGDILLEQKYSDEDDIAFIKEVSKLFEDSRYIRVEGKPLLMIYRVSLFPDIQKTVERWRDYCRQNGIGEIYLVLTHSFEHTDPADVGFDAAVEFSPNTFSVKVQNAKQHFYNKNYNGMVFDYDDAISYSLEMPKPKYKKFKTVFPSWDNEARKPGSGTSFINSTPKKYASWLRKVYQYTEKNFEKVEQFVFINAWNEWAEGAYLEPDRKFGYAYLEATYQAKNTYNVESKICRDITKYKFHKSAKRAIIIHLFYIDLWDEIYSYIQNFDDDIDIYININAKATDVEIDKILSMTPQANIFIFENRGRDILPFIKILRFIEPLGYQYIYKIHSKKSPHRNDGKEWRQHLIMSLMSSKDRIKQVENFLDDESTGLVIAKGNKLFYKDWIGSNKKLIQDLCKKLNIEYDEDFYFPSGSIFCFKPSIYNQLFAVVKDEDFAAESGQVDGTLAHAIERMFGLILKNKKMQIKEV